MKEAEKQKRTNAGHILTREERVREIQKFNLFSDVFLSVALKDRSACEHIFRILTGIDNLKIREVRTQYVIARLHSHDAKLDVFAEDVKGKLYLLEIQRKDTGDHPRRVRYYGSLSDSEFLAKGREYHELPERYQFYISEGDIWKQGKTVYPDDSSEGELSRRIQFLKRDEEGVQQMCELTEMIERRGLERGKKIGADENKRNTAYNLYQMGMAPEQIAKAVEANVSAVREWIK